MNTRHSFRWLWLTFTVTCLTVLLVANQATTQPQGATANADIQTAGGLTVVTFTVDAGRIKVNLPDDIRAGDTISGTAICEPKGKTKEERGANQSELNKLGIRIKFSDLPEEKPKEVSCSDAAVPFTGVLVHDEKSLLGMLVAVFNKLGNTLAQATVPVQATPAGMTPSRAVPKITPITPDPIPEPSGLPSADDIKRGVVVTPLLREAPDLDRRSLPPDPKKTIPTEAGDVVPPLPERSPVFAIPLLGQTGRLIVVTGPFDGNSSNTTLTSSVGLSPVQDVGQNTEKASGGFGLIAESPRKAVFRAPTNVTGPIEVNLKEGNVETKGTYRNVGVNLSAPKTNLLKGEKTILSVRVTGLEGIKQPVPLTLTYEGVINMEGGNFQPLSIQPSQVSADGRYTTTRGITGVQSGVWGATATVVTQLPMGTSASPQPSPSTTAGVQPTGTPLPQAGPGVSPGGVVLTGGAGGPCKKKELEDQLAAAKKACDEKDCSKEQTDLNKASAAASSARSELEKQKRIVEDHLKKLTSGEKRKPLQDALSGSPSETFAREMQSLLDALRALNLDFKFSLTDESDTSRAEGDKKKHQVQWVKLVLKPGVVIWFANKNGSPISDDDVQGLISFIKGKIFGDMSLLNKLDGLSYLAPLAEAEKNDRAAQAALKAAEDALAKCKKEKQELCDRVRELEAALKKCKEETEQAEKRRSDEVKDANRTLDGVKEALDKLAQELERLRNQQQGQTPPPTGGLPQSKPGAVPISSPSADLAADATKAAEKAAESREQAKQALDEAVKAQAAAQAAYENARNNPSEATAQAAVKAAQQATQAVNKAQAAAQTAAADAKNAETLAAQAAQAQLERLKKQRLCTDCLKFLLLHQGEGAKLADQSKQALQALSDALDKLNDTVDKAGKASDILPGALKEQLEKIADALGKISELRDLANQLRGIIAKLNQLAIGGNDPAQFATVLQLTADVLGAIAARIPILGPLADYFKLLADAADAIINGLPNAIGAEAARKFGSMIDDWDCHAYASFLRAYNYDLNRIYQKVFPEAERGIIARIPKAEEKLKQALLAKLKKCCIEWITKECSKRD